MGELSVLDTSSALSILQDDAKKITKILNIRCDDYGFDCDYSIEGVIEKIIDDYWEHMNDEHGIDYSKETIYKSFKKKKISQ